MTLIDITKGAKILETIENYSLTNEIHLTDNQTSEDLSDNFFYDDGLFWKRVINSEDNLWNKKIELYHFIVCDWIARVPGLYWTDYSQSVRKLANDQIAITSKDWVEFYPAGKSQKVLGGIGSLLLPPTEDGKRLISVSSSHNASLGIPLLIYPEIFDHLNLKQGDVIDIHNAKWQPMDISWSQQFASTKDIPRGYLVIDSVDKIKISERGYPVAYHPFSIMEYEYGDAILYDYVYLTVDSKVENLRKKMEDFFQYYASKEGRNGKYLINPDMVRPFLECQYMSPAEMRDPTERAQIELLSKRITNASFNNTTLNALVQILPHHYTTSDSIVKLAMRIGISPGKLRIDNAANMSVQLINYCINTDKIASLTDRMMVEYPSIFNNQ